VKSLTILAIGSFKKSDSEGNEFGVVKDGISINDRKNIDLKGFQNRGYDK
jgi:hypothetical protein